MRSTGGRTHGGYDNQTGYLEGGWAAFYLLIGAAAAPGVRKFSERSTETKARLSRTRLVALAVVSLTARSPTRSS
jgi:hypothetical protein